MTTLFLIGCAIGLVICCFENNGVERMPTREDRDHDSHPDGTHLD